MKKFTILASLLLFPAVTFAAQRLHEYLEAFSAFLSTTVVPFLLAIAFLFFVINAFRFFILGGASEEGREKAKSLAIYSVFAFVLIIVFWGIVNLLSITLGFGGTDQPQNDYVEVMSG